MRRGGEAEETMLAAPKTQLIVQPNGRKDHVWLTLQLTATFAAACGISDAGLGNLCMFSILSGDCLGHPEEEEERLAKTKLQ